MFHKNLYTELKMVKIYLKIKFKRNNICKSFILPLFQHAGFKVKRLRNYNPDLGHQTYRSAGGWLLAAEISLFSPAVVNLSNCRLVLYDVECVWMLQIQLQVMP